MPESRGRGWAFFNQFLLVLMGIVLVYLVISFARQVLVNHQQRQELHALEERIRATSEQRKQLIQTLKEARSDEAVEKWARSVGWARPGEVLVLPFSSSTEPSSNGSSAIQARPDSSPGQPTATEAVRQSWWELFFGTR